MPDLRNIVKEASLQETATAIRLTLQRPNITSMTCMQIGNFWKKVHNTPLKPNPKNIKLYFLSDSTTATHDCYLIPFAGSYGINLSIDSCDFDSVEQMVFQADSHLYTSTPDVIVLQLSHEWLNKYIGHDSLIDTHSINQSIDALKAIVNSMQKYSDSKIIVCPFTPESWTMPGGMIVTTDAVGRHHALNTINNYIFSLVNSRISIMDTYTPLLEAGGVKALGRTSLLRARILTESDGVVSFSRECARTIAGIFGKSYRGVIVDWDNTLWGGLVSEDRPEDLLCGPDSPDALGYSFVQNYLKSLQKLGLVLAAASRNMPTVKNIFEKRPDMPLSLSDFSSVQVNLNSKSSSIQKISSELGFGTEYMLFIDDNIFELTEAVCANPHLDILLAGPNPDDTLAELSHYRPGHITQLLQSDRERSERIKTLTKQRKEQESVGDLPTFLKSIDIQLTFSKLNQHNAPRVEQLLGKSNQFNLTTRRHTLTALKDIEANNGSVVVVEYTDKFGDQGIISVLIVVPDKDQYRIDSWVMSCRVLNRTIEEAMFTWLRHETSSHDILGEFIVTEKNSLVSNLYKSFGMILIDSASPSQTWTTAGSQPLNINPHYCTIHVPDGSLISAI
ncbi:MAG: HAD-IIIC family phosphatase [Fibrobacterales bacterium]